MADGGSELVGDEGLEVARFAYDVQSRQLERSANAAQGLLTAVTLIAALGAPLLLPPPEGGADRVVVGLLMVSYLAALGVSIRSSLLVVATSQRRLKLAPTRPGFLYYRDIASYPSPVEFADAFDAGLRSGSRAHLLDQTWVMASLVAVKSQHVVTSIRWLIVGMVLFALTLLYRYSFVE